MCAVRRAPPVRTSNRSRTVTRTRTGAKDEPSGKATRTPRAPFARATRSAAARPSVRYSALAHVFRPRSRVVGVDGFEQTARRRRASHRAAGERSEVGGPLRPGLPRAAARDEREHQRAEDERDEPADDDDRRLTRAPASSRRILSRPQPASAVARAPGTVRGARTVSGTFRSARLGTSELHQARVALRRGDEDDADPGRRAARRTRPSCGPVTPMTAGTSTAARARRARPSSVRAERQPREPATGDGRRGRAISGTRRAGTPRACRAPARGGLGRRPRHEHRPGRPFPLPQPTGQGGRDGDRVSRRSRGRGRAARSWVVMRAAFGTGPSSGSAAGATNADAARSRRPLIGQAAPSRAASEPRAASLPATALTSARSRAPSGPDGVTRTLTRRPRTAIRVRRSRPTLQRRPRGRPGVAALEQRHGARLGGAARRLLGRAGAQERQRAEPDREQQRQQADHLDRGLARRNRGDASSLRREPCAGGDACPGGGRRTDGMRTVTLTRPPSSVRTRSPRSSAAGSFRRAAARGSRPSASARAAARPPAAAAPRGMPRRRRTARGPRTGRRPAAGPRPAQPRPALVARAGTCLGGSTARARGTRRECAARRASGARKAGGRGRRRGGRALKERPSAPSETAPTQYSE